MSQHQKARKSRPSRGAAPLRSAVALDPAPHGISPLQLAALAVTSLAFYADALRNGFVTDDQLQLLDNRYVTSYRYIPRLFATNVWAFLHSGIGNYYRPLQMLSYMGEYYLFGFHAWTFHLVDLLLNVAVVFAVYFLIRALADETLAFWTALFFALHPVHVEVVVWIAALPELLCALVLFNGMRLYHRARTGIRPFQNYAFGTAVFFAGLFCKETTMVFPALLVAYEFLYRRESIRNVIRGLPRLAPYLGALVMYLVIRIKVLGAFAPGFIRDAQRPGFTHRQILFAIPVLLRQYVFKLLAPINFNYFYRFTPQNALNWNVIASASLAGALILLMFGLRKTEPLLAFAMAWFFLTLAPVLSITSVGENVFTERYLYIPSMGFCVFAARGWLYIRDRANNKLAPRAAYSSLAVLFVFYAVQIARRVPDWRSDLRLLQKTVTQSPEVPQIQSGLGVAYYQAGQFDLAVAPLQRSLILNPKDYLPHLYLALTLSALGNNQEAGAHLLQAYQGIPPFEPPWSLFGQVHANLKEWNQAIDCYRKALALEPENPVLFTVLGEALQENGQTQESISAFREAIRLQPGTLDASTNLAITLAQQGNTGEAIPMLALALRMHPSEPNVDAAWVNLGTMYAQARNLDAAQAAYEHALELNPDSGVARQMLESLARLRAR